MRPTMPWVESCATGADGLWQPAGRLARRISAPTRQPVEIEIRGRILMRYWRKAPASLSNLVAAIPCKGLLSFRPFCAPSQAKRCRQKMPPVLDQPGQGAEILVR